MVHIYKLGDGTYEARAGHVVVLAGACCKTISRLLCLNGVPHQLVYN